MSEFVPGQRWISDTEPELGLGTVLEVDAHRVTVLYIASSQRRMYARRNAPLTRVRFVPGDTVTSVDGWTMTVSSVEERDTVITYTGSDRDGARRQLQEIELDHYLQFNKPQDRLFAGQIDSPALFRLRVQTLRKLEELEQSPIRGLLGPRTSLIPHQLYIAHEVATRHAPRVLLADEVGLGKTIEAGLIIHHRLLTGRIQRILLIVPETLVHQWLVEMRRRFNLRFSLFDDERDVGEETKNPFLVEPLVLCSLEFLMGDSERRQQVFTAGWDLCVIDEAHHLRFTDEDPSPEYRFAERLASRCPGLLLLTATPEQWGKASHFARLRLLDPDRYHDYAQFVKEEKDYESLADVLSALVDRKDLNERTLRRMRSFLTDDRAEELCAQIADSERSESARSELIQLLLDRHGTGRVLFRNTRTAVGGFPSRELHLYPLPLPDRYQQLLQQPDLEARACLQPESLCYDVSEAKREWWRTDSRVLWLIPFLKDLRGAKALVICAQARTALGIEEALRVLGGIRAAVFHEGMTLVARDRAAAWFADEEDGARVLVCSEIGSEGRNFQFAHHLVLFDLPLTPDLLEQRIGRLDRIGQNETVQIHLPFFQHSAQDALRRLYQEGLNAFNHPCPAGQQVFEQLTADLTDTLTHPEAERVTSLIERTRHLNNRLLEALHAGRDRLLELNSCRPDPARRLLEQIEKYDKDPELWRYLEAVFDAYGVNVEDHSRSCYILTPGDHLRVPHFPELSDEGATVTLDRSVALAREDMLFLTWEHPMVRGIIDLLLNSEHGNAAFSLAKHPDLDPGHLLVETFLLIESPAPRHLQVGRFLPPTLLHILIDADGQQLPSRVIESLHEQSSPIVPEELCQLMRAQRRLIEDLLKRAEQLARSKLPQLIADAQQRMLTSLTGELKRLAALRRVNPSVRQEELDQIKKEGLELHTTIQSAQLRLEAVRVIVTV